MYATNMDHFGHLINPDNFNTSLTRPEMFEIMTNLQDWQGRFIRPEYYDFVSGKNESLQVKLSCFFFDKSFKLQINSTYINSFFCFI